MGNPASNTVDCFRELIGRRIVGVLFNALPRGRADLSAGTKTIVMDDGRGLTISSSGTFWIESAEDVKTAVMARKVELDQTRREIAEIITLSGVLT